MTQDEDLSVKKYKLLGSLLHFIQVFYRLRTGRNFNVSEPIGRESHHITVCRELTKIFNCEGDLLKINLPPRYGKSEIVIHFVAWALAHYPDSNFIYVSYSLSLAKKQTQTIREIVNLPLYKRIFGVELKGDTNAKDNFETTHGGSVYAAGSGGTITGRGAGIQGCNDRFSGAFIMDDMHKPDEVSSDTVRDGVIDWYSGTANSRMNNPGKTAQIGIGQLLHEADIFSTFTEEKGWKSCIIPALDETGNALNPEMHTAFQLRKMQEENPYHFAAQYMQNPQPSGGGIFKPEWLHIVEEDPEVLETFITVDTAETDKDYNDATVFSFWGLHKIKHGESYTDLYGLYWIDCLEIRVEPKDLQPEFMQFYADCMRYSVKPKILAIEKKSTGSTLFSVLKSLQGLNTIDISRTKASGSKTSRFLEAQPYVASKCISLHKYSSHTDMCIEHLRKITANNTHRFDDIADTMYDAIKLALIDKIFINRVEKNSSTDVIVASLANKFKREQKLRSNIKW